MRVVGIAALAVALCTLPTARAAGPQNAVVLGDSQGEGVALASGLKNLAHISVHIRGPKAVQQVNGAPIGATAFIVLGSNDAECCLSGLDHNIDAIVQAADQRNIKLVWIGPPCVRRAWNPRVRELDEMLQRRLTGTSVKYVSMYDDTICSGALHDRDGVHMTMKGYSYMWQKASAAAGFTVAEAASAAATASASATDGDAKSAPKTAPATATAETAAVTHEPPRVATHRRPTRTASVGVPRTAPVTIYRDRQAGGG